MAAPAVIIVRSSFFGQVRALVNVLWVSRERNHLIWLSIGLAVVILLTAAGQVRLNTWWGSFYDALARRDLGQFGQQLALFGIIIAFLVVFGVSQTWLQEMLKIRLREGLTRDLLEQWLRPRYAYRLAALGEIAVNPDQRLQEDARHLTELTAELAIGLFQQGVLLCSFVGLLWVLSDRISLPIEGRSVTVPGYMVWCALAYASAGSLLTWFVGRPLIRFNAEHYAKEAMLRFSLVRVSEAAEGIALDGGEEIERRQLDLVLSQVIEIMRKLANRLAKLTWITSSYGYFALLFPIAVASPGYFEGTLSFGALMMVVGAFNQVQGSLRWAVDNFPRIADWSATFLRVMTFYDALLGLGKLDKAPSELSVVEDQEGKLKFRHLTVNLPGGRGGLIEGDVEIAPGERVQIVGEPGAGKAGLFRLLAGLSSAGSGTLSLPPRKSMMFLPQRPYLPAGPLRNVLTYPLAAEISDDARLTAALERVGLGRLGSALGQAENWARELTLAEQQCLAIVRALVHRPAWLVMNEVFDALDERGRGSLIEILKRDLSGTAVVSIDPAAFTSPLFSRTLHLRELPAIGAADDTDAESDQRPRPVPANLRRKRRGGAG